MGAVGGRNEGGRSYPCLPNMDRSMVGIALLPSNFHYLGDIFWSLGVSVMLIRKHHPLERWREWAMSAFLSCHIITGEHYFNKMDYVSFAGL